MDPHFPPNEDPLCEDSTSEINEDQMLPASTFELEGGLEAPENQQQASESSSPIENEADKQSENESVGGTLNILDSYLPSNVPDADMALGDRSV